MATPYIVDNVTQPVNDDWAAIIKLSQAGSTPPLPLNLTGWEFYLVITKDLTWDDDEAYVFKTVTPLSPTTGVVEFLVPAEQLVDTGRYYRGIKAKTSSGTRITLLSGTFDLVAAGPKEL